MAEALLCWRESLTPLLNARFSPTMKTIFEYFFPQSEHGSFSETVYEKWTSAQAFFSIILFYHPLPNPEKMKRKAREKLFLWSFSMLNMREMKRERIVSQMVAAEKWWNVEDVGWGGWTPIHEINFYSTTWKTKNTEFL